MAHLPEQKIVPTPSERPAYRLLQENQSPAYFGLWLEIFLQISEPVTFSAMKDAHGFDSGALNRGGVT